MSVSVSLAEIVDALQMQGESISYYLDRQTGVVEMVSDPDYAGEIEENEALMEAIDNDTEGRYVPLPDEFDVHEYAMMEDFARHLEDDGAANTLLNAIQGRGAFRRFKDRVQEMGLAERWYEFRDGRYREFAIEWCKENDVVYHEGRTA